MHKRLILEQPTSAGVSPIQILAPLDPNQKTPVTVEHQGVIYARVAESIPHTLPADPDFPAQSPTVVAADLYRAVSLVG